MGKKHKKKHKKSSYQYPNSILEMRTKEKKDINKDFNRALKEIEEMQIKLYEADKKKDKKNKKKINKAEAEFYTSMSSLKARKKMSKKWEKTGFLDNMIVLLQQVSPIIKTLAKALCYLLISFLSVDAIKKTISPSMLSKITSIFNIAMAI